MNGATAAEFMKAFRALVEQAAQDRGMIEAVLGSLIGKKLSSGGAKYAARAQRLAHDFANGFWQSPG
jgi:hypothetical protein